MVPVNTNQRRYLFATMMVIIVTKIMLGAEAFSVQPPPSSSAQRSVKLNSSVLSSQQQQRESNVAGKAKAAAIAATAASATAASDRLPAWIDLPSRRKDDDFAVLEDVEMMIGRVAMVGATALIFQELFTGESILEQVMDLQSHFHV